MVVRCDGFFLIVLKGKIKCYKIIVSYLMYFDCLSDMRVSNYV